jgi:hypothetical protein
MLEGPEDVGVAARRIDRPYAGDDQQRPEIGRQHKSDAGGEHHRRRNFEQPPLAIAMRDQADTERHRAGTEQRCRHDRADDFKRAESEQSQVVRQQQAYIAVAERAQSPRPQQQRRIGQHAGRQEPKRGGRARHGARA